MDIQTNVAYLAALSMAAERLTEINRGIPQLKLVFPKKDAPPPTASIDERNNAAIAESTRSAKVHTLAVGTGVVTAALAYQIHVLPVASNWAEVIIFGVLAGAGSGFWNAILAYLLQLRDLNKALSEETRQRAIQRMTLRQAEPMVLSKAAGQD